METGQGSGQEALSGMGTAPQFSAIQDDSRKGAKWKLGEHIPVSHHQVGRVGPSNWFADYLLARAVHQAHYWVIVFFNFLFHHNFRFTEQLQEQYKKSSHMSFTKMLTFYQSCFIIFLNIYTLFLPKPLQSKLQPQWPSSPKYFPRYSLNTGTFS